jgi:hypothetical protein
MEKEQTFEKSKLEPATRDNLEWSKFGYWGHLILYHKQRLESTYHMDLKEVEPKLIDLDWAKECYMNLNIKQNSKQHMIT